jgi:hypothetical protein
MRGRYEDGAYIPYGVMTCVLCVITCVRYLRVVSRVLCVLV